MSGGRRAVRSCGAEKNGRTLSDKRKKCLKIVGNERRGKERNENKRSKKERKIPLPPSCAEGIVTHAVPKCAWSCATRDWGPIRLLNNPYILEMWLAAQGQY